MFSECSWRGWLARVSSSCHFNFDASARSTPLRIHLQGFVFDDTVSSNQSLLSAMTRPAFLSILEHFEDHEPESGACAIIYVDNRKQARFSCWFDDFDNGRVCPLCRFKFQSRVSWGFFPVCPKPDGNWQRFGIDFECPAAPWNRFYHESLSGKDKSIVSEAQCVRKGSLLWCHGRPREFWGTAPLVIVLGTHHYEGRERRFVEYPPVTFSACSDTLKASSKLRL